jgi:transposase-like protein
MTPQAKGAKIVRKNATEVKCPACGADVWRFGVEPKTGFQRYRCKSPGCRAQFVLERQHGSWEKAQMRCPKCGCGMSVFKRLSDCVRYRCNRAHAKGARKCAHKINIPLPGTGGFGGIKRPKEIRLIRDRVAYVFHWRKMKFTPETVALVLYHTFFMALPAPRIVHLMRTVHNVSISHDTVTRWSHKGAFMLSGKCGNLAPPETKRGRKPRILADETRFKTRGLKRWFWLAYVPRYDMFLGSNLSARRDTQAARDTFSMAFHNAPHLKGSEILTDGLWSYGSALPDLGVAQGKHIVYKSFFESPNNNRLERKWSNFKTRARPFRGFKSDIGLGAFLESQVVYHNVFKPSPALKGKTPAQAAGFKIPDAPNDWLRLARILKS